MFEFIESPKYISDPARTLGVEVTRPDTLARCGLGNLDEQHRPGGDGRAAIEVALTCPLPPDGAHLVTDRPDLDSIGAMAVLALRLLGVELHEDALARVRQVADADNFRAPPAWAPSPLPTTDQPWPTGPAAVGETRALAAAAMLCAAGVAPWPVAMIAAWLLGGEPTTWEEMDRMHRVGAWPAAKRINGMCAHSTLTYDEWREARGSADAQRLRLVAAAREALTEREGIAFVSSTEQGAIGLGYCVAPVVIATNPRFRWPSGEVTEKTTIAFYASPGPERLQRVVDALNAAEGLAPGEGGWGGNLRSGIIGSPQGRAPLATAEQIEAAVRAAIGGAS